MTMLESSMQFLLEETLSFCSCCQQNRQKYIKSIDGSLKICNVCAKYLISSIESSLEKASNNYTSRLTEENANKYNLSIKVPINCAFHSEKIKIQYQVCVFYGNVIEPPFCCDVCLYRAKDL